MPDLAKDEVAAQRALNIAFQTMQERCHQLENRLSAVEEENVRLRVNKSKEQCANLNSNEHKDLPTVQCLQEKIEELTKQKSQLTHHVFMVAAENRQLWNRLTRLTRTNKNLGSKLIKISDTLKKNPNSQPTVDTSVYNITQVPLNIDKSADYNSLDVVDTKDVSLEEISLRLINSIMLEKSELEQQYSKMIELENGDINLRNVGFTYPDDNNSDSLHQLKQHEARLSQTKYTLVSQQAKLKRILHNLKENQKGNKKLCQTGTQFESDNNSLREHGSTQTSLPISTSPQPEKLVAVASSINNSVDNDKVCPLCGLCFEQSTPFHFFHEHVLSHFAAERTSEFDL